MTTTTSTIPVRTMTVPANGTELYAEVRGDGPAVLLIAGGTSDAGQLEGVAAALSDRHTVCTYDRRGNSRSARPEGWTATDADEQADDAAALLLALGLPPAVVYGHSIGAVVALNLALRHPELVERLVLHDPAMLSVLADPQAVLGVVGPVIEGGMQAGGPGSAARAFWEFAAGEALQALDRTTYERMLRNGEVLFGIEFQALSGWRPDEQSLPSLRMPVHCVVGRQSAPFMAEAASWIAERTGGEVTEISGGHGAMFDRPAEVAAALAARP